MCLRENGNNYENKEYIWEIFAIHLDVSKYDFPPELYRIFSVKIHNNSITCYFKFLFPFVFINTYSFKIIQLIFLNILNFI